MVQVFFPHYAYQQLLISKHTIDALVEDLITTIEKSVGDDYIVILTSSAAKAPMVSQHTLLFIQHEYSIDIVD
jgi:hypothetical protein